MKKAVKTFFLSMALVAVPSVAMVSCSKSSEPEVSVSLSEEYSGIYDGTISLNVTDQYSYKAALSNVIIKGDNETISVSLPEYSLAGTMMGDMTLGTLTIDGLKYDEAKGGFYRNYGGEGILQTMNGTTYPLNPPAYILVVKDTYGNLTIENSFMLGKMPLPFTATFKEGK